jgi:hypothetical protein
MMKREFRLDSIAFIIVSSATSGGQARNIVRSQAAVNRRTRVAAPLWRADN